LALSRQGAMPFMSLNPRPPSAPLEQGFADFSTVQRALLDQILVSLDSEQGVSALIFENGDRAPEATRYLASQLPETVRATWLEAPWQSESEFLQALCRALDIPAPAHASAQSVPHLIAHLVASLNEVGQLAAPSVLIVKNAHLASEAVMGHLMALSLEALERAKRWSRPAPLDPSSERAGWLYTLLIGRQELRQRLPRESASLPYGGRLAIYHFPDLSELDTIDHIREAMGKAGWIGPLPFDMAALKCIHTASEGLPTRIDRICQGALNLAKERHSPTVTVALVAEFLGQPAPVEAAAPALAASTPVKAAIWPIRAALASPAWPKAKSFSIAGAALMAVITGSAVLFGTDGPTEATAPTQSPIAPLPMARESVPDMQRPAEPQALVVTAAESLPIGPVVAQPPMESALSGPLVPPKAPPASVNAQPAPSGTAFPALATLSDDADSGWGPIAALWGLTLNGSKACDEVLKQGHQCFRTLDADLPALKALDRPGLALLQQGDTLRWVQLTKWSGDSLTLVVDQASWHMPSAQFAQLWAGQFKTLWRHPPDQTTRLYAAKPNEAAGLWLDQQLQKLQAQGQLSKAASSAQARIVAFQKQQGLPGHGKALPSTFIAVNQLAGVTEPRLSS
jgi:type II secretory pathway predicted ATPase ExeA